jgi:hypothetical protein
MTSQTIINKDPAELRPHSLVKDLPRWAKDDPRFYGLCDDIRDNGIQTPLKITQEGRVLDGELCRLAARALQMDSVPCVIVPDDQATETVLRGLVRRRHLTKGQLAFLAVPLIQPAFEESQRRRMMNNPACQTKRTEFASGASVADYAANMGMSARYMQMAKVLFDLIADNPEPHEFEIEADDKTVTKTMTLKDWVIIRLFDPEKPQGLTEINKAAGCFAAYWENPAKRTGGAPQDEDGQLKLLFRVESDLSTRWDYWQDCDKNQKLAYFEKVKSAFSVLPPDKLEGMAQYHEVMARTLRKAAKEAQAEEAA